MTAIQVGQTYETVGGLPIRIITTINNLNRPFVGAITLYNKDNQPYEVVKQYNLEGKLSPHSPNHDDIDLQEPTHA